MVGHVCHTNEETLVRFLQTVREGRENYLLVAVLEDL